MVNNVNIDYDSFNEIYLNIPADAGGSTNVYFDAVYDKNYQKGEIIDVLRRADLHQSDLRPVESIVTFQLLCNNHSVCCSFCILSR